MAQQDVLNNSAPSNCVKNAQQSPQQLKIPSLDSIDRLSIWITGKIALDYPEISAMIAMCDRQATPFFWEEVSSAIREALPSLDMVEISQLQDKLKSQDI